MDSILEHMAIGFAAKCILEQGRMATTAKIAGAGALGAGAAYAANKFRKTPEQPKQQAATQATEVRTSGTPTKNVDNDPGQMGRQLYMPNTPTKTQSIKSEGPTMGVGSGQPIAKAKEYIKPTSSLQADVSKPMGGLGSKIAAAQKGYREKVAAHQAEMSKKIGADKEIKMNVQPTLGKDTASALKQYDTDQNKFLPKLGKTIKNVYNRATSSDNKPSSSVQSTLKAFHGMN